MKGPHEHYRPLHDAAWYNQEDCARVLHEKNADLGAMNMDGQTALHLAAQLGYVEFAKWLIEAANEVLTTVLTKAKSPEAQKDWKGSSCTRDASSPLKSLRPSP